MVEDKMKLVITNPEEDGFLRHIDWNLEEIKRFSILRELGTMFRTVAAVCGKDFD